MGHYGNDSSSAAKMRIPSFSGESDNLNDYKDLVHSWRRCTNICESKKALILVHDLRSSGINRKDLLSSIDEDRLEVVPFKWRKDVLWKAGPEGKYVSAGTVQLETDTQSGRCGVSA